MHTPARRPPILLALALALAACGGPPATPDAGSTPPTILDVSAPEPAVEGSILAVRGLGLDRLGAAPQLAIERGGPISVLDGTVDPGDGRLLFELSADAVDQLGPGRHDLTLRARGQGVESEPFAFPIQIVNDLPVDLFEVPRGEAQRNDVAAVVGNGILGATEGTVVARFEGTFTFDAGGSVDVDVTRPVSALERGDRERGLVVLTTDIGSMMPGTFDGTIRLESQLRSGQRSESAALATSLHFNPPELYGLSSTTASLGEILSVSGGGFLGGPDRPDELTLLRIEGTFTPAGGGTPEAFGPVEIPPMFVSGSEVRLVIEPELRDDELVSMLFGHARGTFMGQATPITVDGTEELEGSTIPFGLALGSVRQVVHVRFLPGFYESLERFGLASAAPEIEAHVQDRMESIYVAWNVDFRFEEPDDFSRTAYAVIEIGGPDPNGVGLFGYDNTPGKDIGNLRLYDQIGGTNAETQSDGYPGYGGVFVESFLYWSSHPELPGDPPNGAPEPAPLFDEVFDPVRSQPATRAEAQGEGSDPDRNAAVRQAIEALSSIIGETSSHELGHSLGMAQPYGSPTVYHNDFDGEGCLMDSGGDRPLGERMGLSGFAPTQFCYDHPSYLSEILGR